MASIVPKIFFRFLRLRYLIVGGAVSGGAYVHQRYEDVKSALPDFSPIVEALPSRESIAELYSKLASLEFPDVHLSLPNGEAISARFQNARNNAKLWFNARISETGTSDPLFFDLEDLDTYRFAQGDFTGDILRSATSSGVALAAFRQPSNDEKISGDAAHARTTSDGSDGVSPVQEDMIGLQVRYQREIDRLERENRELRRQTMMLAGRGNESGDGKSARSKLRKPLIDLYSEVLDDLLDFEQLGTQYSMHDHLPRVVVVGDQSSGKTSVLEVIAKARIFPRGSGEMMTRTPVKVTLSEGPYHIARFKDSPREFDLTREDELSALRHEIEVRMKANIQGGDTVSAECIALTVKGPGLPRMVLIDLPGLITTQTAGMAPDTREKIKTICQQYLENPSAIILCVQDGSVDAERNAVTELVSAADEDGRRTIFVMTKADLAEATFSDTNRVAQILEGRLFQMRALGYFAVVTGKGNSPATIQEIQKYEQDFFGKSRVFRGGGPIKTSQLTTHNLVMAVSDCFWRMVRESSAQQVDALKALRYNLETEWKNSFGRHRQLDRAELFDRARADVLDELASLSLLHVRHWHDLLAARLWQRLGPTLVDNILFPSMEANQFDTAVDVRLRQWADSGELPKACVTVGLETLQEAAATALDNAHAPDPIFAPVREIIRRGTVANHTWDNKAEDALRIIQRASLDDTTVSNKQQWQAAVDLMRRSLNDIEVDTTKRISSLCGPSTMDQWVRWKPRPNEEQMAARSLVSELERLLAATRDRTGAGEFLNAAGGILSPDELAAAKHSAETQGGVPVSKELMQSVWSAVKRREMARRVLAEADLCEKSYHLLQHVRGSQPQTKTRLTPEISSCSSVLLFHRLRHTLDSSTSALRQQLIGGELARLEGEARDELEAIGNDRQRLQKLLVGRRVDLSEGLKRVRHMQGLLEEFLAALNDGGAPPKPNVDNSRAS